MFRASLLLILGVSLLAAPAHAGQVRVDVVSNVFSPNSVSLNQGDHVVFVWVSGSHTATSGTVIISPPTITPDGLFASGPQVGVFSNGGSAFTWKSTVTGNRPFYCQPHALTGMTGTLNIQTTGVAVSDFRITEVQYGAAGGADRIEVTNMGDAAGDLGRYRISLSNTATELDILPQNVAMAPGARVTIHTNQTGTNTATDLFVPGIGDLPLTGSVTLYAPYRQSSTVPGPLNANTIIDFVQWGGASQPNSGNALAFWDETEFVAGESLPAYSISFCGARPDRGASFWSVTAANFGGGGICSTPALNTSWGRIKTLYR